MGLHRHTADLLERTARLVAEDGSFASLVRAIEQILVLHVSREPLEAHHLAGIVDLAGTAYARACYLLPGLAAIPESDEKDVLDVLNSLQQAALTLGDDRDRRALRHDRLRELMATPGCPAVLRGAAAGLLFGDGELDPASAGGLFPRPPARVLATASTRGRRFSAASCTRRGACSGWFPRSSRACMRSFGSGRRTFSSRSCRSSGWPLPISLPASAITWLSAWRQLR